MRRPVRVLIAVAGAALLAGTPAFRRLGVGRRHAADTSGLARGAAWTGDISGMAQVAVPAPSESVLRSVAFAGGTVELAGEAEQGGGSGPGPLLISATASGWRIEGLPYDRGLSAVAISPRGRLWVSGPVFGGWLGGDPPHAELLTRAG